MAPVPLQDELIDDSNNDNPVAGLKCSLSLQDRFRYRLSRMLRRAVTVYEAQDSETVNLYVAPERGATSSAMMYDNRVRKFTGDLQHTLQSIARSTDGPQKEEASQDQWDVILLYVSSSIHDTIMSLQHTFKVYIKKFDAVVAQTLGLDDVDEYGSSLDTDLGDIIIRLQQFANSYDGTVKQQNKLIEFAWSLLQRCSAADVRLRCLLGSAFSNKLYDLICELSHPLSTHHTLVRTASAFAVFRAVRIHLELPPPPPPPPPSPKAISSPPRISTSPQQQQALQLYRPASLTRTITPPHDNMMETVRQYLPEEDRGLSLLGLQPTSKQAAALLIGCLLHKIIVPPGSDTYYLFGFVTCRNDKEEYDLVDYYRQLLKTSLEPTVIFTSIMKALEHNTLTGLLRNRGPHNLDKSFPELQQFLTVQPDKRFSVHRLVQFIRDEGNDEPLPCLKRDFGFKFCTQREHVTNLKALYAKIIDNTGPGKLHYACIHGRLLEFAIGILGFVSLSMRRLLQNDYPNPSVGYDNSQGLDKYVMPLFKRPLRS